jgi:16S rRNA pseudouridine516 synthase
MRLDKYLVQTTGLSRSAAQKSIRAGRVTVEGRACRDPAHKLRSGESICLDGAELLLRGPRYIMVHKPQGYICATRDDRQPTVLELLPPDQREGLHIAGRLDIDTTGLVLLTDDGAWSHRVTSPRHNCGKRYRVELAEPFSVQDEQRLREGIVLRGDKRPTRPAGVERLGERALLLTIDEGRYHQVKRMFGALGNRVVSLHRDRIGEVELDESVSQPGAFRDLTPAEVAALG